MANDDDYMQMYGNDSLERCHQKGPSSVGRIEARRNAVNRDLEEAMQHAGVKDVLEFNHTTGLAKTFVSIDQERIREAISVCEIAIENTRECLSEHLAVLGRTTKKNNWIADRYERELAESERCLAKLRECMGWPAKQVTRC